MAAAYNFEWPGRDSSGKEVVVDPDKLDEVADKFADLLERYTSGPGAPRTMQTNCALQYGMAGDTEVGDALISVSKDVYSTLGPFYDEFVTQLQNAIGAIRSSAGTYRGADQATQSTAASVDSQATTDTGGAW